MRICVMGAGYVGLTTAAVMNKDGWNLVVVYDVDKSKIEALRQGNCPIFEPGLQDALKGVHYTYCDNVLKVDDFDVVLICVGTPSRMDGRIETGYVQKAIQLIKESGKKFQAVFIRSTVLPGITHDAEKELEHSPVVHHPEFFQQGKALNGAASNLLVFGHSNKITEGYLRSVAATMYSCTPSEPNFRFSNQETTELAKYANNVFLAMKISFANEIANVADFVGARYESLKSIIGADPRIGESFLNAGCGFGGSCLPKDTNALVNFIEDEVREFPLGKAILEANYCAVEAGYDLIWWNLPSGANKEATLIVDGAGFKYGTDDMRSSAANEVLKNVLKAYQGVNVKFVDHLLCEKKGTVDLGVLNGFSSRVSFVPAYGILDAVQNENNLIVLAQEKSTDPNGLTRIAQNNPWLKVLDLRPTKEKRALVNRAQYLPLYGDLVLS